MPKDHIDIMAESFFEIAKSDTYKTKFSEQMSFVEENGQEYYSEDNLRKKLTQNEKDLARAKHPRGIRDYKVNAVRFKRMIKNSIWFADEVDRRKLREPS